MTQERPSDFRDIGSFERPALKTWERVARCFP